MALPVIAGAATVAGGVGLSVLKNVTDLMRSARADSLIEYTKAMRVEPNVLIDTDCMFHEGLHDLMQVLQNTFCGYYMQGVAVSTQIGSISVMGQLGKLNPSRDVGDAAIDLAGTGIGVLGGLMLAKESYALGLPSLKKQTIKPALESMALEAKDDDKRKDKDEDNKEDLSKLATRGQISPSRDVTAQLNELANLSVGKVLSVEITDGNAKATFPVTVRLLANSIPSNTLVHILSGDDIEMDVFKRFKDAWDGRISFFRDFLLCEDIIEAKRQKMKNDNSGVYTQILDRKRKNQLAALLSGRPSVASASNMVIMSDTTLAQLEVANNMTFKSFSQREKLFGETALMIIAVIDKRFDRVTFYHRSIPETSNVSFRDLKSSSKGAGPDIAQILAAYQLGSSPSI